MKSDLKMASEKDATCENDPNFAIICAFFEKFSTMLNIQPPEIKRLQEWLENTDEVFPGLKELHIKLMRKLRKTVHQTAWETALAKFCYTYSSQDAWEIERFGYKKSSLKVKLRILKELVESQFQRNGKFRNNFGSLSADELRSQPIGRDQLGHSYWLTRDKECNLRIYQEHLDEEIWQVVASSRDELVTLIARLKGNEVVLPSLVGIADEDSSSNSCVEPIVKPPPPEEQDSPDEKPDGTDQNAPNIKIKLDTSKITSEKINGNQKKKQDEKSENDTALSEEMEEEEEEEGEEEEGEEEEDEEIEEDDEEDETVDAKPPDNKNNKDKKENLVSSTKIESKSEDKVITKPSNDSEKVDSDTEKMVVDEPKKVDIREPEKLVDEPEEIVNTEPEKVEVTKSDKVADNKSEEQANNETEEAIISENEEIIISESEEVIVSESEDHAVSEPEKITVCEPEDQVANEPVIKSSVIESENEISKIEDAKIESDKKVVIESENNAAIDSEKEVIIKSEKADSVSEDVAIEPEKEVVTEPDKKDIDVLVTVAESEEIIKEPEKDVVKEPAKLDTIESEMTEEPEIIVDESENVISDHEEPEVKTDANGKHDAEENRDDKSKTMSPPKVTATNGDKNPKKRSLDELDKQDNGDMENITKKSRPTLLGVNREKKISKYEKYGEELDEEEENEEAEEEGSEEDDEEEDDGSVEEEVGDEIVEEVMVIKCSGSGKDCESGYINSIDFGCEESETIVSEAIEEETYYVVGEGSGEECLVGNTKESTEESTLHIKETNCLKTDSVKQKESKLPENDNCLDNKDNGAKVNCVEDKETDICRNKVRNGENLDNTKDKSNESDIVKDTTLSNDVDSEDKTTDNDLDTSKKLKDKATKTTSSTSSSNQKIIEENSEHNTDSNIDKTNTKEKIIKVVEKNEPKSSNRNRKRKLTEDCKPISENETDLNSEVIEETTEAENDIGGKRLKMRNKVVNSNMRKKVEEKRNKENEEGSSSDDENAEERQLAKISNSKIDDKCTDVETKECVSEPPELLKEDQLASDSVKNSPKDIETSQIKREKQSPVLEIVCNSKTIPTAEADISTPQKDKSEDEAPPEIIMQVKTRSGRKISIEPAAPSKRKAKVSAASAQKGNAKNKKGKNVNNTPEKPAEVKLEASENVETIPEAETSTTVKQETEEPVKPAKSPSPTPEIAKVEKEENKEPVKKKQRRTIIEIDTSNIIETDSDITPVRQSRRIAQLKIREEAERRKLEEVALKKMKQDLKRKKKEEKKILNDPTVTELSEPSDKDSDVDSEAQMKKKLEKKKRGVKRGGWSSGSEEDEEEEEAEYEEAEYDPGSPLFKSDHEFSPESEVEDESEVVPTKRARTARKEGEPTEEVKDHEACQKCGKKDHPQWILLCDKCNKGYHCSCLSPVLFIIPEGDWFCPPCQQEQLIEALESELNSYDILVAKQKAEVELQIAAEAQEAAAAIAENQPKIIDSKPLKLLKSGKQPRRKYMKHKEPEENKGNGGKGKSISNGESEDDERSSNSSSNSSRSNSSSSSSTSSSNTDSEDEPIYKLRKRRQINVSYRFHEYDDLINSAIKREMDEVAGAGNLGRGKDISTIIEADKEEKMRQKQLEAQKDQPDFNESCSKEQFPNSDVLVMPTEVKEDPLLEKIASPKTKEDSGSDFEPVKVKPKFINRKNLKKKNRKLNSLDISSEDDGSDEDFKTSSYETEEDEEDISAPTDSDSSLEIYKRKSKKSKKTKRSSRRAARARRKRYEEDDDFIVQDSDGSDFPKIKKKRKIDSEYSESETDEEELSDEVDSDELCDDSTDSDESDGAWKPSSKKKQKKAQKKKLFKKSSHKKNKRKSDDGRAFKGSYSKKKIYDDSDDDSLDSGRRTRGKRFTYLEDYEDESSDDGIKPGVKRPDTPPEEREKFIRRQEEIKRMLAEKNTEAAKAAATPTLIPISKSNKPEGAYDATASISTVPLSVIKGAKALDIDYLQRKGELESDDPETDFDDDLPDDFNPEDMDEEEIAKMMEEEDFAQQQLKLAGESIQKKKTKDVDTFVSRPEYEPVRVPRFVTPIQDPNRKKLPIPTIYPIIGNHPFNKVINNPANYARLPTPPHRLLMQQVHRPPHHMNTARSQLAQSILSKPNSASTAQHSVAPSPPSSQTLSSSSNAHEAQKPRGRRKKITPLRDPLQKQQAAAAAAAAAAAGNPSQGQSPKESSPVLEKSPPASAPNLSVAQPPQLYKPPSNTQPSVITRMPQPPRPRFTEQSSRYYPPSQLGHRPPPPRLSSLPMPPHHVLRPSYVGGPPPLRPSGNGPPVSLGNSIPRHSLTRQPSPFGNTEQFPPRSRHSAPLNPYRPPLYGTPGYPPAPPGPPSGPSPQTPARTQPQTPPGPPPPQLPSNLHSGATDYSVSAYTAPPYGSYYPPPIGTTHSTPPPPTATAVPSSVIVTAASNTTPSPTPAVTEPVPPPPTGPKATPLETFDSKSTPPLETESTRSPYSAATPPEEREEGPDGAATNSTSEFSGLVSYFSSQQDDLNT